MNLSESKINVIASYLKDKPVLKAYIFGSYARGDADEKSDLDLMVEIDYSSKIGLQFFTMKHDLESIMKTHVDLVTPSSITPYIKPVIESEKKLIYEK